MKQGVVIAAYLLGAALLPLAAAADPGPPSAAESVLAPINRGLFSQCAAGRDAAASLAERRDNATLAAADAAFARCTRTSRNMDGVASAELGIAATAYLSAQSRSGEARRAALGRAADYANRADEDWRSYHQIGVPSAGIPATAMVETQQGTDATLRVEVGLPGGPAPQYGSFDGGRVPDAQSPAHTYLTGFDRLALGIVDEARSQIARVEPTK